MQGPLTVVGVKSFKGEIEGTAHDFTKVLVLLPFPRARIDTNSGHDVVPAVYGKVENYQKFKGLKYPLVIDAEYEVTSKGIELYEVKIAAPVKPT